MRALRACSSLPPPPITGIGAFLIQPSQSVDWAEVEAERWPPRGSGGDLG